MDVKKAREALENFVTNNSIHLRRDFFTVVAPSVNPDHEKDCLVSYIRSNNPYIIFERCFASLRLTLLAIDQLKIDSDLDMHHRELIDAMLEAKELGFTKEVKPEGLFQIRENLELCLKRAESDTQLGASEILGLCVEMAQTMEKLLDKLFLFHSHILLPNANRKVANIQKLCQTYKEGPMKTLGSYIQFLRCLVKFAQEDEALRDYCQRNFRCEVPLHPNQIAELTLFTTYRNLIIHSQNQKDWEKNKKRFESNLNKIDNPTKEEWKTSWENVVRAVDSQGTFPVREMLQKMANFFRRFFDLLTEGQFYPKVIVMRSYTVDDYGTCQITAVDDVGETVFLSGCGFKPFTEFYCHLRANSFGFNPILVSKAQLEHETIQSDENAEKQKET